MRGSLCFALVALVGRAMHSLKSGLTACSSTKLGTACVIQCTRAMNRAINDSTLRGLLVVLIRLLVLLLHPSSLVIRVVVVIACHGCRMARVAKPSCDRAPTRPSPPPGASIVRTAPCKAACDANGPQREALILTTNFTKSCLLHGGCESCWAMSPRSAGAALLRPHQPLDA